MRLFRIRRYPPQKRRNRTPSYLAAPRSASENSNYLPNKPFSRFLASSSSFLRFASASASARFCASACTCPAFCSAVCSAFDESTPKARPSNAVPPSFTIWFTAGFRSRSAAVGFQAGPKPDGGMRVDGTLDLPGTVALAPATIAALTGGKVKPANPIPVNLKLIGPAWNPTAADLDLKPPLDQIVKEGGTAVLGRAFCVDLAKAQP